MKYSDSTSLSICAVLQVMLHKVLRTEITAKGCLDVLMPLRYRRAYRFGLWHDVLEGLFCMVPILRASPLCAARHNRMCISRCSAGLARPVVQHAWDLSIARSAKLDAMNALCVALQPNLGLCRHCLAFADAVQVAADT